MAEKAGIEEFVHRTGQYVRRHDLFAPGDAVVAGVSGGADSVALASALRAAGNCALRIAHVHHGLRAGADADADFVADLAGAWGVPFHLERIDTRACARKWGVGIEEAARRGRYDALAAVAGRTGAPAVAVAHHADDQVETVLHRIVRGTHLRGLVGMAPRRELGEGVDLVRPLLWARRARIEEFCRRQGLAWRTDRTNAETDFTRNFIRHELLPMLRDRVNVRADEALLRLSAAAGEATEALEALARGLFDRACRRSAPDQVVLRLGPLRKGPPLLAAMALRRALAAIAAPEQHLNRQRFDDLLALLAGHAAAVDLPGGVRAERRGQALWLTRPGPGDAED